TPHRPGGPPIWIGGMVRASLERVGRLYDGWFPNSPDPGKWREQWGEIHRIAREAGRTPAQLTGAVYLTLTIDEDKASAAGRMTSRRGRAGWGRMGSARPAALASAAEPLGSLPELHRAAI